ncbi:YjjG family noncanonical pyrimidine nucleotidase [Bacteroidota bacterium]|nr:YjjG family noncanonical pyrimidine nucleotidase [Bacteroidota bacterium]
MKLIKNIFFDLDHTLWDFDKNSDLTFFKILKKNDISIDVSKFLNCYHPINRKYWEMYRENKVSKADLRYYRLFDTFKKLNYDINDNLINQLSIDYIEHLSDFNHLIPDTLNVLELLKSKYKMHIITNGFKEVQKRKLQKSDLIQYFKTVTISEDVGVKKPHKLIFNHALTAANANVESSIMIGDNFNADILGALGIGMKAIYYDFHKTNEQERENVIIVKSLKEIIPILL